MKTSYTVSFTEKRETPENGYIVIYQVEESWNDFGYKIKCNYVARTKREGTLINGIIFVGLLPPIDVSEEGKTQFYEQVNKYRLNDETVIKDLLSKKIRFFTMLPSLQGYRSLVSEAGVDSAKEILFALNDLVVNKQEPLSNSWVEEAESTECFKLAFMRNSEPFFAYHNADSILDGIDQESFIGISNYLNLTYKLEGFETDHQINLRYSSESIVPKRINILIGKNGLGKSQALTNFCRAALRYEDKHNSLTDPKQKNGRPMISRLLAIGTPGETSNTFPSERKKTQKLFYRRLNLTRNGRSASTRKIGELLVQLVRSDEYIGEKSRWDIFLDAIDNVLPREKIGITLKSGVSIPIRHLRKGGEQSNLELWAGVSADSDPKYLVKGESYPLSSGQLTFVKFALLACLYIENGSFVLMDEPETHLHPNMIANFVELLDYILENTGSQALIATHSAYFVREVSREQVHVFKSENENQISIVSPRLKTFGADVDSISQFVFEEDVESRLTDKIFDKVKNQSFPEIDAALSQELSLSALMDIKRRMEGLNEEA